MTRPLQSGNATDSHAIWALSISSTRPRGQLQAAVSTAVMNQLIQPLGKALPASVSLANALQFAVLPLMLTVAEAIPPGLSCDLRTGRLKGIPTASGTYILTVNATDTRLAATFVTVQLALTILPSGNTLLTTEFFTPLGRPWLLRGQASAMSDASGSFLRLTDGTTNSYGSAEYRVPLSATTGLDIRFVQSQNGGDGGDGIVLYLRDGSSTLTDMSDSAAGFGFTPDRRTSPITVGMPGALLAVGLSAGSYFAGSSALDGTGCGNDDRLVHAQLANSIVIRGGAVGGDSTAGYCRLGSATVAANFFTASTPQNRSLRSRAIRVLLDAPDSTMQMLRVYTTASAGSSFAGLLEVLAVNISSVPSLAALAAASSVYLGFAAIGGSGTNVHAVTNLEVADLGITGRATASSGTTMSVPTFDIGRVYGQDVEMFAYSSSYDFVTASYDNEGSFVKIGYNTGSIGTTGWMELRQPLPLSHGLDVKFVMSQASNRSGHVLCGTIGDRDWDEYCVHRLHAILRASAEPAPIQLLICASTSPWLYPPRCMQHGNNGGNALVLYIRDAIDWAYSDSGPYAASNLGSSSLGGGFSQQVGSYGYLPCSGGPPCSSRSGLYNALLGVGLGRFG